MTLYDNILEAINDRISAGIYNGYPEANGQEGAAKACTIMALQEVFGILVDLQFYETQQGRIESSSSISIAAEKVKNKIQELELMP